MGSVYKRDGRYGIDYVDGRGVRVRKMVASDKSVAQKMLGDAIEAAEKSRAGLRSSDPREGKRPLADHLREYLNELHRLGRAAMYRYNIQKHIEYAAKTQRWVRLGDCSSAGISAHLRALAAADRKPKTVNAHLADLSAFFAWCVRTARLEANPCQTVQKSAVRADKTRRALSVVECEALLAATPSARKIVYHFLLLTGLRRGEAKALRWSDIRLDALNPTLSLPASITKSGRPEALPLAPDLAEAMREYRSKAGEQGFVFESIPSMWLFRKDLKAAGIQEVDDRGRRVVLHSLRHSLATMLAMSRVPMAYAQRLLRHRDIRLTAETYQDEALLPLAGAVASLPAFGTPSARTGTRINGA